MDWKTMSDNEILNHFAGGFDSESKRAYNLSRLAEMELRSRLIKLQSLIIRENKLKECIKLCLYQRESDYGMDEPDASHFRQRRIFGLIEECLKEIEGE